MATLSSQLVVSDFSVTTMTTTTVTTVWHQNSRNVSPSLCSASSTRYRFNFRGKGVLPIAGPYGEVPPERGTFFRLQVYKRVGILLVKVYKRVGNLSFGSVKGPKGPKRWILWLYKDGKMFYFCDWFLFKRQCIYSSWKGCKVVNKVCERGIPCIPLYILCYLFCEKWYIKVSWSQSGNWNDPTKPLYGQSLT